MPTLAARILCGRIADGRLAPGARPCLGAFDLAEVEAAAAGLRARFARDAAPVAPLFETALGPRFAALPAPVQALHRVVDARRWQGRAQVERGRTPLSALVCAVMGFPRSGADLPVSVEMRREGAREIWRRRFAGRDFSFEMRLAGPPGSGRVSERFGPFRFEIPLACDADGLGFPVARGWLFGVPLPRRLLPVSRTVERAADGAARFDVEISMPGAGRIVRYAGWLRECGVED